MFPADPANCNTMDHAMANDTLGIIGVGGLATFIVEGLRHGGDHRPILLSPRNARQAAALAARCAATVASDNQAVVNGADIVMVATPPKVTLDTIRSLTFQPGQRLICVAIDIGLSDLHEAAPGTVIVRAMPSAAAAICMDSTPVCPAAPWALTFFAATGTSHGFDDEAAFGAATALSVFHLWSFALMDTMVGEAEAAGIPRADAVRLVAATIRSAGAVAAAADPALPVRAPLDLHGKAGTMTAAGMALLEAADAFGPWRTAFRAALARARQVRPD
jgi:pyrroline-5-carboxylate reductase